MCFNESVTCQLATLVGQYTLESFCPQFLSTRIREPGFLNTGDRDISVCHHHLAKIFNLQRVLPNKARISQGRMIEETSQSIVLELRYAVRGKIVDK